MDELKNTTLLPVTVVIPVKNEEANLPDCLAALKRFEYVVVVDSGSSDSTVEIAEQAGAEVIQFEWDGRFPKKRNWVLRNYHFKNKWVLFIDADEVVSDAFCDELGKKIARADFCGFWLKYTNYFMGARLMHGVPQRKLACFQVGAGEYEKIEEENWSNLDMEIHEHPVLEGEIDEIGTPIDHRDFRGLARFLDRHIDYARWETSRYLKIQSNDDGVTSRFTGRQKFKYQHLESRWFASFYFFYTYIIRLGFLDGSAGYQYASYKRWYFQTVRNLIRERRGR